MFEELSLIFAEAVLELGGVEEEEEDEEDEEELPRSVACVFFLKRWFFW